MSNVWETLIAGIGVKPGDTAASRGGASSSAGDSARQSTSGAGGHSSSAARPDVPGSRAYTRDGPTWARANAAAAAAAEARQRYQDDDGEWTDETYRPGYRPEADGGGTHENARAGFSAGYYSRPDEDLIRRQTRMNTETNTRIPVREPKTKWEKIDDGYTGAQTEEEAEWLRQANAWKSGHANTAEENDERGAAAAERRQTAAQRAEEAWLRQQRENVESERNARREASRVEDEDFEVQIALAMSASAASNDPHAQLLAELELEEHRKAAGAAGSDVGRSRGQALAASYWISHCLDTDEELNEDADGFYDMWGDYTEAEAAEGGRCPTLRALLELRGGSDDLGREAVLIDRRTDICLAELCETARKGAEGFGLSKPMEVRASWLAMFVARRLGGQLKEGEEATLEAAWAAAASDLRLNGKGGVMRIGDLPVGLSRHRALLYKAIASCVGVKCRLMRGAEYCGRDDVAKVVVVTPAGQEMEVDLMYSPGRLSKPMGAQPPPKTPPARERPASEFTQEPQEPQGDSSWYGGADEGESAEDVAVAELMSTHGVTLEEAFDALMRANYEMEHAHLLCQASCVLGLKVADVYDLLVLSGWQLEKAVMMAMDAMEDHQRGDSAERARADRARRAAAAAAAANTSRPAAQSRPAPSAQRPSGPSAHTGPRPPPRPAAAAANNKTARKAEAVAAERLREMRAQSAKDAKEAESADVVRRRFHEEWDRKVAAMDLPSILRAFGIDVPGGRVPSAAVVRKAYREALLKFHPDRQREATLANRVRAEEMFKMITSKMEAYHGA